MQGQSNPEYVSHPPPALTLTNHFSVTYEQVTCPAAIVAKSGCSVSGYKAPLDANAQTSTSPSQQSPTTVASQPKTLTTSTVKTQSTSKASALYPSTTAEVDGLSSLASGKEGNGFVDEDDECEV